MISLEKSLILIKVISYTERTKIFDSSLISESINQPKTLLLILKSLVFMVSSINQIIYFLCRRPSNNQ